ncbi:hypothetical protein D3C81_1722620 [compost metagenome]
MDIEPLAHDQRGQQIAFQLLGDDGHDQHLDRKRRRLGQAHQHSGNRGQNSPDIRNHIGHHGDQGQNNGELQADNRIADPQEDTHA